MKITIALLLLSSPCLASGPATGHIRNFGEVNQNLFRGGAPTDEALTELKALGVNLVIDLRETGDGRAAEKQKVEQLGIRYAPIPMRAVGAPRPGEIEQAFALMLRDSSAKIYVHCLRGKDRTGTVIACYRIQHDGWNNLRALEEARSYGMSRLELSMQSFILRFMPLTLPALLVSGH